jgi:hypothetical protein
LIFRLDELVNGSVQLRAETRAEFPGVLGKIYRAMVIGTASVRRPMLRAKTLLTALAAPDRPAGVSGGTGAITMLIAVDTSTWPLRRESLRVHFGCRKRDFMASVEGR